MFEAKSSYPVGKVIQMEMYPLCFKELVHGSKEQKLYDYMTQYKFDGPVLNVVHERLLELFDMYTILGGYPEVVSLYLNKGLVAAK